MILFLDFSAGCLFMICAPHRLINAFRWSFLTIDTSDFLADGLGHVASRMAYVFDRLMALER
jgi:hypothetical protein